MPVLSAVPVRPLVRVSIQLERPSLEREGTIYFDSRAWGLTEREAMRLVQQTIDDPYMNNGTLFIQVQDDYESVHEGGTGGLGESPSE